MPAFRLGSRLRYPSGVVCGFREALEGELGGFMGEIAFVFVREVDVWNRALEQ
jgi:hypothetical protein